jgi:hypothetical protein
LKELRQKEDIHVCESDRNLGLASGNSINYKAQVFTEYLDKATYKELTENQANEMNAETTGMIRELFKHESGLPKAEMTFLGRLFKLPKRIHKLYGGPKHQKNPLKWRPIVSRVGGITELVSKWVDYHLKQLPKGAPTFL